MIVYVGLEMQHRRPAMPSNVTASRSSLRTHFPAEENPNQKDLNCPIKYPDNDLGFTYLFREPR